MLRMGSVSTLLAPSYRCQQHSAPFRGTALRAQLGSARHGKSNWSKAACTIAPEHRSFIVRNAAASSEVSTPEDGVQSTDDVQAILFDMDGVLCNSEEMSQRVGAQTLLQEYGVHVQPEEFRQFAGMGEAHFLRGVAGKHGVHIEDIDQLKEIYYGIYLAKVAESNENIGLPGAVELVRACRQAGLKTAVASSADRVKVDCNLKLVGFEAAADFDAIVSADLFERLKPAPDIFLAAARELGVNPACCVVVEDAAAGVQAARAAGMRVIGVTTTLSQEQILAQAPDAVRGAIADISVDTLQSLEYAGEAQAEELMSAERAAGNASAGPSDQVHSSLDVLELPGGYATSRRAALKAVALAGGLGSVYVLLTRAKSYPGFRRFLKRYHIPALIQLGIAAYVATALPYWRKALSFASPKALLNALLPRAAPDKLSPAASERAERVAAFRRFIDGVERRGGGEVVPEFPAGAQWFNAPPLKLARELAGKVLVLDYFTYCCINCMHVLPELAALEAKYAGRPVAVVGVHSAKFDNEKDNEAIRNAVLRYDITHPVVNDSNMVMWRDLGVSSWPTLVVVSPRGRVLAMLPGEGQKQTVDDMLAAALEYYGDRGQLREASVPAMLEREKSSASLASPLRYPGKLAADLAGKRLFISDSNNHRVVITDLVGKYLDQIGGNGPSLRDGSFESAALNRPQGLAYSAAQDCLYVADTENNALREVDFRERKVRTLAGNGSKAVNDYVGGRKGRAQQLNSPWDLALDSRGDALYIAMAGQHQIWVHDLRSGTTRVFSGTGNERNANGRNGPSTSWAQPSGLGLSLAGDELWVADSESSTVRSCDLDSGAGRPHVGGDKLFSDNLFRFGDRDGSGTDALLQHPLGVLALRDGSVLVADSYNHRLKVLDPAKDTIRTVAGAGTAGFADGLALKAKLSEPAGLCIGPGDTVFVADTNNSSVRVFNTAEGSLTTLELIGVPQPNISPDAPQAVADSSAEEPLVSAGATVVTPEVPIRSTESRLHLSFQLPPGYHLTKGAKSRFEAAAYGPNTAGVKVQPISGLLQEDGQTRPVDIQVVLPSAGQVDAVVVNAKIFFCQDEDVCLFEEVVFRVPVTDVVYSGESTVDLSYSLSPKASTTASPL